MSGKLKYHWRIVDMSGYDCSTGYCVTCPVCGFSYRVAYNDSFRFCPECGRQLCNRKQITYDEMVYNVTRWIKEREVVAEDYERIIEISRREASDQIRKIHEGWNASCENCEHAYRGGDPLNIIQDSKCLFHCSTGHAYGGVETVCSDWKMKEGESE